MSYSGNSKKFLNKFRIHVRNTQIIFDYFKDYTNSLRFIMGSHWKMFLYYRKFCVTTINNNPNSVWLISFFPKLDHVFPMNIARFESHHRVWFKFATTCYNFPAYIYFFKVTKRSIKRRCEICSKLTIKTLFILNIFHAFF